ncbi:MAG: YARHG domain-containing protein [Bacteroidaceae bacterium]|nr:YARHG domain-containing protein [Bacteroidaceae bacterium]
MKKVLLSLCVMMGVGTMQAQIDNGGNWYNGRLIYSASDEDGGKVLMNAMAEGEEHEFLLVPVAGKADTYRVTKSENDYVMEYDAGSTVLHQKKEGWDVLCFYNAKNQLEGVMTNEKEWNDEKLSKAKWLNQMTGEYVADKGKENELNVDFAWERLSINGEMTSYEVETFNGSVTGYITIAPIEGSTNRLEGLWQVVPTLEGLRFYAVKKTGDYFYERERTGKYIDLVESNPEVGRFFFASTVLLNNGLSQYEKSTLRVMRNAILARHGYVFQSKDLQDYFSKEPWYKPAASNDNIKLSLIEQLNVELIQFAEKR